MLYSSLCYLAPTSLVLVIGSLIAIGRWPRHPQVSLAILIAATCLLVANVGQQLLYHYLTRGGVSFSDVAIYFQIIAVAGSLIRAAGWGTMTAAIFGWRGPVTPGSASRWQFSIRGLLVVTFVVAIACGLLRWLAVLLGESAEILLTLVDDIPVFLCWIVGARLAWTRWRLHPEASRTTLIAIGLAWLALVLNLAFLLTIRRYYALGWPMLLNAASYLVLWPATWILLLRAALGWRTRAVDLPGTPFRQPFP